MSPPTARHTEVAAKGGAGSNHGPAVDPASAIGSGSPPDQEVFAMSVAALYVRVSSDRQTAANQLAELQQLASARGFEPVVYEEVESAARARPVLDGMLADARAGRVRAIMVWALDRLHRSMIGSIQTVLECDRIGVPVVSLREPWLDTSGPVRPLLVAIFGWVAEQERARLIERTRAGIERARRQGKRLGRPPASPVLLHAALDLVGRGVPAAEAARRFSLSRTTLRRFVARSPRAAT